MQQQPLELMSYSQIILPSRLTQLITLWMYVSAVIPRGIGIFLYE